MKKISVLNVNGSKISEIDKPYFFSENVREDIIARLFLSLKLQHKQPYGIFPLAGRESSSGKQRHRRRKYKTLYGYGISRVPRKVMSRRGDRFYWVGAFAPGTVGGRQAHPPKNKIFDLKINKKEKKKALISALSATASEEWIKKRYPIYEKEIKNVEFPFVLEKIEKKEIETLKNYLKQRIGNLADRLMSKKKKIRAGKGKRRGRKYKKTAGLLLVISSKEKNKFDNFGIETVKANKVGVNHLAPGGVPGRFTIFTLGAIRELEERLGSKIEGGEKK